MGKNAKQRARLRARTEQAQESAAQHQGAPAGSSVSTQVVQQPLSAQQRVVTRSSTFATSIDSIQTRLAQLQAPEGPYLRQRTGRRTGTTGSEGSVQGVEGCNRFLDVHAYAGDIRSDFDKHPLDKHLKISYCKALYDFMVQYASKCPRMYNTFDEYYLSLDAICRAVIQDSVWRSALIIYDYKRQKLKTRESKRRHKQQCVAAKADC